MTPEEMIKSEIEKRGMTIKAVSDRTGVRYSCLQPCLKGKREFRADEYLSICKLFGLDPRGYQETGERGA